MSNCYLKTKKKITKRIAKIRKVPIAKPHMRLLNSIIFIIVEIGSGFCDTSMTLFPYGDGVKSTTLYKRDI